MDKPLFSHPCNHCGLCCRLSLCDVATILFEKEQCIEPPCPALLVEGDKSLCGLVITEQATMPKEQWLITKGLGIGCGCSMADESTTEEQIKEQDKKAVLMYEN